MQNVKVAVPAKQAAWRKEVVSRVETLEAPLNPSAFSGQTPKVCHQGLEEICLASTVVASG